MSKTYRLTSEEVLERFKEHPDLTEALEKWAHFTFATGSRAVTNGALIDELIRLLDFIDTTPVELEVEDSA